MSGRSYGKNRFQKQIPQKTQVLKYNINQVRWSVFKRNKTFYVKFNFPPRSGKFKAYTLHTGNERVARAKAEAVVSDFLLRQGLPPIPTLSRFSKAYLLNLVRSVSHKHYTQRARYCTSLEKYFGKSTKLEHINSKSILDEFMIRTQKSRSKPLSNASMNAWRGFLISYLNLGIRQGYLTSNDAYELAVQKPHARTNRYNGGQLKLLYQACLDVSRQAKDHQLVMKHFYIVFGLLVRTGRRISEVLNIKIQDIKSYSGSKTDDGIRMKSLVPDLVILLRDTKNQEDTEVFVSRDIAQHVLELKNSRKGEKYLFPFKPRRAKNQLGEETESIPSDIVKPVWRRVTKLAGVRGGLHDVRRTFTVYATTMKVPRKVLMDISGWKTEHMIDHYSAFDKRERYEYTMEVAQRLPLF